MSLAKLECPICEFVFEADIQESERVRCNCCSHLFSPGRSTIQTSASPNVRPLSDKKEPTAQNDSAPIVARSEQVRASITLQRVKAKRRNNIILLLLFLSTLVSGALVAMRLRNVEELQQQHVADSNLSPAFPDQSAITPVPPILVESDQREPQSPKPAITKENPEDNQQKVPEPPTALPADPLKFQFLSPEVAVDQAALTKPYMVLLEIESPAGTTYATGTIVDSRGFLLTSLPAVKGATKIQISSARNVSQIKNQTAPTESGTVRSVVAVSQSQQWALLEIDRRFVLNAADIRIPKTDQIVSRQPLLRVVAPRTPQDHAASEMRVDTRQKSSQLTAQQKELLGISDGDGELNWVLSPRASYDRLGAALISIDGKLMAMLVNFDPQTSYYINTSDLGRRLRESNFRLQPLSSLR